MEEFVVSKPAANEPHHVQVIQIATSYWVSRALFLCAKLAIADHLSDGPRSSADLARTCGTNEGATYRLLRALAMVGLVASARIESSTPRPR